jgi:tRNA threonylcarbamoyladenosine biosynthesis protein TsaB
VILLALDTTAEYGSIALFTGGTLLEEVPLHEPNGYGQAILQHIQALLTRHGLKPTDVGCYASATGPGSFTGVRICVSVAKGLAESCGAKVAGVSNLRAIAAYGETHVRAALLDARRGEIYGGVYDASLHSLLPETVSPFARWLETVPGEAEFVTQNVPLFGPALPHGRIVRPAPRAIAAALGRLVLADGESAMLDPAALDANYVRRSDAELMWKEV